MRNQVIIPMSRDEFTAKCQEAIARGIQITSDHGQCTVSQGLPAGETVGLEYEFNGAALVITVLHHPWFIGETKIETKIKELLKCN